MSSNNPSYSRKPTSIRYGVLLLLAIAASSAYLTRICLSAANTTIQKDLHFTTEQMGWILSMFFVGYLSFQVPGGWLGTRLGPRSAFSIISILWSLFNLLCAKVTSYVPMLILRGAFGASQAGLVPITTLVINNWFPEKRRGFSSAVIEMSMSIGGMVSLGLTASLLEYYHWKEVFSMYSWVGIIWAIVFFLYFRNKPKEHRWVNCAENRLIFGKIPSSPDLLQQTIHKPKQPSNTSSSKVGSAALSKTLIKNMVTSGSLWGICAQQFLRAAAYALFVTWFPAFLEKGYGVTRIDSGLFTMYPLISVVIGLMTGGLLVDYLLIRTNNKWVSRSLVACVGLGISGLLTLSSIWTSSPLQLVLVLSLGAMIGSFAGPPSWTATMDIAGRYSGLLMAVMNMAGNAGAFLLPIVLGYLIGHIERTGGDWSLVIYLIASIQLLGSSCWIFIKPNKTIIHTTLESENQ